MARCASALGKGGGNCPPPNLGLAFSKYDTKHCSTNSKHQRTAAN